MKGTNRILMDDIEEDSDDEGESPLKNLMKE